MLYTKRLKTGNQYPISHYTASAVIYSGDMVVKDTSTQKIAPIAAGGTAFCGWADHDAVSGDTVQVTDAAKGVIVTMPYTGTATTSIPHSYVAVTLNAAGKTIVSIDNTTADVLRVISIDTATTRCEVESIGAQSQVRDAEA